MSEKKIIITDQTDDLKQKGIESLKDALSSNTTDTFRVVYEPNALDATPDPNEVIIVKFDPRQTDKVQAAIRGGITIILAVENQEEADQVTSLFTPQPETLITNPSIPLAKVAGIIIQIFKKLQKTIPTSQTELA